MARKVERPKPPYAQVADALRADILGAMLEPGSIIPSEREIAKEWGVSRATATKAVAALKSQGLVESEVGVGTRVRDFDGAISWSPHDRFYNLERTGRVRAPGEKVRFDIDVVEAPEDVRDALRLKNGSNAIRRSRVTSVRNAVVELSTSWFDAELEATCPDLLKDASIRRGTTHYVAEQRNVDVGHAVQIVRAELAADEDAVNFRTDLPSAVLVTELTIFDHHGEPLVYEVYRLPASHRSMFQYDL